MNQPDPVDPEKTTSYQSPEQAEPQPLIAKDSNPRTTTPPETDAQGSVTTDQSLSDKRTFELIENDPSNTDPDLPQIEGYTITSKVGKGGIGQVYEGVEVALGRRVAIKTLQSGSDNGRFEQEARISAQLEHPNILPVYRAGNYLDTTTPSTTINKSFLAMKLVRGKDVRERLKDRNDKAATSVYWLRVFESICQTVGYAHENGFIHLDLKPANVMIDEFDKVQVMDWGLAEDLRLNQPNSNGVKGTNLQGRVSGTLSYMAPEQANGGVVDSRSDVFALGGIFCAILTGEGIYTGPNDEVRLFKAAGGKTEEAVERLKNSGHPQKLIEIACQCLEIDPDKRPKDGYAVANLIAEYWNSIETDRLENEMAAQKAETDRVAAEAKLTEQRKRYRQIALATGVTVLFLLVGLTVSLWQRSRAIKAKEETAEQLLLTQKAEAETASQLEKTKIAQKETIAQLEKTVKAEAETASQLEKTKIAQKETEDQLVLTKKAEADANEKLGYYMNAVKILTSFFEGLHPYSTPSTVVEYRNSLIESVEKTIKQLDEAKIGDPVVVARMLNSLGDSLLALMEYDKAFEVFQRTEKILEGRLGDNDHDTLVSKNGLATCYQVRKQYEKAEALFTFILKKRIENLEPDNPHTLSSRNNLALCYKVQNKLKEARDEYILTLEGKRKILKENHISTLVTANNLALCHAELKEFSEAIKLFTDTLKRQERHLKDDHPETMTTRNNFGWCYFAKGEVEKNNGEVEKAKKEYEQAKELYKKNLQLQEPKLGSNHPHTIGTMTNLFNCYFRTEEYSDAAKLMEKQLDRQQNKWPNGHPDMLFSLRGLAECYKKMGDTDKYKSTMVKFEELLAKYPPPKKAPDKK